MRGRGPSSRAKRPQKGALHSIQNGGGVQGPGHLLSLGNTTMNASTQKRTTEMQSWRGNCALWGGEGRLCVLRLVEPPPCGRIVHTAPSPQRPGRTFMDKTDAPHRSEGYTQSSGSITGSQTAARKMQTSSLEAALLWYPLVHPHPQDCIPPLRVFCAGTMAAQGVEIRPKLSQTERPCAGDCRGDPPCPSWGIDLAVRFVHLRFASSVRSGVRSLGPLCCVGVIEMSGVRAQGKRPLWGPISGERQCE